MNWFVKLCLFLRLFPDPLSVSDLLPFHEGTSANRFITNVDDNCRFFPLNHSFSFFPGLSSQSIWVRLPHRTMSGFQIHVKKVTSETRWKGMERWAQLFRSFVLLCTKIKHLDHVWIHTVFSNKRWRVAWGLTPLHVTTGSFAIAFPSAWTTFCTFPNF